MRNRSIDTKMFQRIQFRSLVVRCVGAALAAGALVATVPRCAKAEDRAQARRDRCAAALQDGARPPGGAKVSNLVTPVSKVRGKTGACAEGS
jgi:hypothetical protein